MLMKIRGTKRQIVPNKVWTNSRNIGIQDIMPQLPLSDW